MATQMRSGSYEVTKINYSRPEKRADCAVVRRDSRADEMFPPKVVCHWPALGLVILPLFVWALQPALAQPRVPSEPELKARLVYQFALLTQWPSVAFPTNNTNFVIGVLGDQEVFEVLNAATNLVQNRNLYVTNLMDVQGAESCHLIFVSETNASKVAQLFAHLKDASVLTVGEGSEFLRMGGMIKLWTDPRRRAKSFRFEINDDAAQRAKLSLSPQLLRLSEPEKKP